MADDGARSWFPEPCPLLPMPEVLRAQQGFRCAASHAATAGCPAPPSPTPRKERRSKERAATSSLRDPAEDYGEERVGRCRIRRGGVVVVVPNTLEDFCGKYAEAVEECLVVELEWAGGMGWLDDPEVAKVLVAGNGGGPQQCVELGISDLRSFVRRRVDLGRKRTRNPARSILTACSPSPGTTITLVPLRELAPLRAPSPGERSTAAA